MEKVEESVKSIIIKKYGNLKKFCEKIEMPWTTLDSILKRGIANSNITNVMKITKELNIDTESLASGVILQYGEQNIDRKVVSKSDFPKIMQYYNLLNDTGKDVATERVKELTYIPNYTSKNFNEEISEEIYTHFTNEEDAEKYLSSQKVLAAFKEKDGDISKNDKIKIANIIYKNSQK